jgi:acetyl-CoA carboxylase biotin carboxyl carrier protein
MTMIGHLVRLMARHDLTEIELTRGDQRVRLRRGPRGKVVAVPPDAVVTPVSTPTPAAADTTVAPPRPARHLIDVKSPGPGTFYAQEKPGAAPYVTLGARVTPTTIVGQIEAMKTYNEITADCSGVIAEVCVENAQIIEYGQVLFRVDPAG